MHGIKQKIQSQKQRKIEITFPSYLNPIYNVYMYIKTNVFIGLNIYKEEQEWGKKINNL